MDKKVPNGIHDNPVTFTWFFRFRIKSLGECIGVLEMACKCIKHKKNIAQHFFRFFSCIFLLF